jgi:transcription elongation factor SPT6
MQEEMDEAQQDPDKQLALDDVFEPSQLVDKMLTEEDNVIRNTDVPERFQIARKPFQVPGQSEEEMRETVTEHLKEEALWIMQMLWPKKRLERYFQEPFHASIRKTLEFLNLEDLEIPFIFQHRKDYLIHEPRSDSYDQDDYVPTKAEKMLTQDDMWEVFDLDLKWKGLSEKREAIRSTYQRLQDMQEKGDEVLDELLSKAVTIEEVQDLQDYFHFQYSAEIRDVNITETEANGTLKRARNARNVWEKIRSSRVYNLVRAFGLTADAFAQNAAGSGPRHYTEDPSDRPDDLADSLLDPPEYTTGAQILRAAKAMYAEELVMSPRLRRYFREAYYTGGKFDCYRTEKGARQITEDSRYYEFKYLRNQDFNALARRPELYLRMLQAESEGLVEVKVTLHNQTSFRERLFTFLESDNLSDLADAWNTLRKEVLSTAVDKLEQVIAKGVKEALKSECENLIGKLVRAKYSEKLDQAPFKVKGLKPGSPPRVLALSNGAGVMNRDAVCWVYMEDDGRVLENGKFVDLRPGNSEKYLADGKDVATLVELVHRRKPDVIGVSGFSVETRKLYKDLQDIIDKHGLQVTDDGGDDDDDDDDANKLEVIIVNDEVARLYHTSDRAIADFPSLPPIGRYCVGLARYVQSPLLEYAALRKNITAISFDPNQDLLSEDKLMKWLDSAMVDMVNLVGVNLEVALSDSYRANLLPYVAGLGPRKADHLLKMVNHNVRLLSQI